MLQQMQREEQKLKIEIKAMAKKGQIPAAKIMAKVTCLCPACSNMQNL
jgi:hypothetical protein